MTPDAPGRPAVIHLRSRVVECDCNAPSLTLEDGRTITGDLVIGADGVHVSRTLSQDAFLTHRDSLPCAVSWLRKTLPQPRPVAARSDS